MRGVYQTITTRLHFGMERNAALLFWALFFLQAAFGTSDRFKTLYIESLGARPALVGVILGVAELIRLSFLLASGHLSDRLSPRLLINTRWFAVANAVIFLLAWHWWALFPAFFFQAAANMAWVAVSGVIDESGDPASRARRFLMVYTVAPGIAFLAAPLLGGYLAGRFGLRSVFVVLTIGLVLSSLFFSRVTPTARSTAVARHPSGGYLAVVRHRPAALLCGLALAGLFVAYLGMTLAPNYLHNERGVSIGLLGAFGSLIAAGSIVAGLAVARVAWLTRSMHGSLLTFACLPAVFFLMLAGGGTVVVAAAFLVWGVASVSQQTFYSVLSDATPPHLRARAFALLEAAWSGGIMLAGFAAGALYGLSPALPLWLAALGGLLMIAATALVRRALLTWRAKDAPDHIAEMGLTNAA